MTVAAVSGAAGGDGAERRSSPFNEGATAEAGVPAGEGAWAAASCMMGSCANFVLLPPPALCRFFRFLSFGLGVRHLKHSDFDPNTSASHFGQFQSAGGPAESSIAWGAGAGLTLATGLGAMPLPSTLDSRPVLPCRRGAAAYTSRRAHAIGVRTDAQHERVQWPLAHTDLPVCLPRPRRHPCRPCA